jgi:hypothetical protein
MNMKTFAPQAVADLSHRNFRDAERIAGDWPDRAANVDDDLFARELARYAHRSRPDLGSSMMTRSAWSAIFATLSLEMPFQGPS